MTIIMIMMMMIIPIIIMTMNWRGELYQIGWRCRYEGYLGQSRAAKWSPQALGRFRSVMGCWFTLSVSTAKRRIVSWLTGGCFQVSRGLLTRRSGWSLWLFLLRFITYYYFVHPTFMLSLLLVYLLCIPTFNRLSQL